MTRALLGAVAIVFGATAAHAQDTTTKLASGCVRRAPTDTGRVVLADTAAPRRWPREIAETVSRHEICSGMTADMLRKSWGLPLNIQATFPTSPGDTTAQYFYRGATVVLINSRIRAIRPPTPAVPRQPR